MPLYQEAGPVHEACMQRGTASFLVTRSYLAAFWPVTGVCHLTQKGDSDRTFPTFFSQLIPSIPHPAPSPAHPYARLRLPQVGGGVGEQLSKA